MTPQLEALVERVIGDLDAVIADAAITYARTKGAMDWSQVAFRRVEALRPLVDHMLMLETRLQDATTQIMVRDAIAAAVRGGPLP